MAALIGEEAEGIAWRFGAMAKNSLYENLDGRSNFSLRDRFGGDPIPLRKDELTDLRRAWRTPFFETASCSTS